MPMNQLATSEESLTDWLNQRNAWRRKVDITENVVPAYGYEGYYWSQEKIGNLFGMILKRKSKKMSLRWKKSQMRFVNRFNGCYLVTFKQ